MSRISVGFHSRVWWKAGWAVSRLPLLCVLAFVFGAGASYAQTSQTELSDADKAGYADALAYCRGDVPRPIALRDDKRVLCFDGPIDNPIDPWTVYGLVQGGLFVVRSAGGVMGAAIPLADLLLGKQATVIVNGYCLANCANYLFVASVAAFVPKDSLVAWRNVIESGECAAFSETGDRGAPHFGSGPCGSEFHDGRNRYFDQFRTKFYQGRIRGFQSPPESVAIRRMLKRGFDETGKYPTDVFWTWNPKFYSAYLRTKVFYEAYPPTQDELDALVARVGLKERIIHDP